MVKYTMPPVSLTEALKIIQDINKQHPILVAIFTDDGTILDDATDIVINGNAIQVGIEVPWIELLE